MSHPIRVLQVVTIMNLGGLENFLMNLYRNVDRTKVQFDFLVHRHGEDVFDKEIIALEGKIYRLNPIRPHRYFQYRSELNLFLKKHSEYNIIHSHINVNSTLVLSAAKKAGIPIRIAHSHASTTTDKYKFLREILIKRLSKYSTHNIACSLDAGKWLFNNESYVILNNSIDTRKFQFDINIRKQIRESLNIKDSDIVIGNVANFSRVKNHRFLLNVFGGYNSLYPKSKLILVGDGDLKEKIENQIQDLGLKNQIILTGAIQNPQDYLNAMDLYLFTSIFEGLGISIVEAQCNGLPVLMSDSIPQDVMLTDLIHQESLSNSEKDWAYRMEKILLSYKNNERKEYSNNIKEKGFDVELNAKKIENLYLNTLNLK